MGIAYMPIVTMVSQVFVEHRAIAFGIMSSGVGIGKFICPLLLHELEEKYGWRGAILMTGGLCLNLCTCAMIYFRPGLQKPLPGGHGGRLPPLPESPDGEEGIKEVMGSKCDVENRGNCSEQNGDSRVMNGGQRGSGALRLNLMDRIANAGSVISLSGSMTSVRAENGLKKSNLEVSFASSLQNTEYIESIKREIAREGSMGGIAGAFSTSSLFLNNLGSASSEHLPPHHNNMLAHCKQIGSFNSRLGIAKQPSYTITLSNTELPRSYDANGLASLPASQMPSSVNMPAELSEMDCQQKNSLFENLNVHLMANPSFTILAINNLLFAMGYAVSNVHLPAFSMKVGLSQIEGGYFLSGIGIASIVGKISLGALSNTTLFSPMTVYIFTFFIVSVATIAVPLCSTFAHFMSYAIFFGFCSGSFGALLPTVVVSMTTVDLLPSAYGFLLVFEATGFLIGPSIAGGLYDWIGEYSASFYFGGVMMVLSSIIMIYPWYKKNQTTTEFPQDVQEQEEIA